MSYTIIEINTIITGVIESLAFGGEGILRHQGCVIFVPFTVPGEHIECRITEVKKKFARATLINILQKSPKRVQPECPYYTHCGGCQLQHLSYEEQLKHKQEAVTAILQRIGGITLEQPPSITPSPNQWASRRHITLHIQPKTQGYEAGYIRGDNFKLLPIETCPIFSTPQDAVIANLQTTLAQFDHANPLQGHVQIFKGKEQGDYIFSFHLASIPPKFKGIFKDACEKYRNWQGILASSPNQSLTIGNPSIELSLEGMMIKTSPLAFLQNNSDQSLAIYLHLLQGVLESKARTVLDLYCGIGLTSLLIAKQGLSVTGIESNRHAIQIAKDNANSLGLKHTHFQVGHVEHLLSSELKKTVPDAVILNPPRTGLDPKILPILLKHKPQQLYYISCMPSTLARDLKALQTEYSITDCRLYDMFPQTSHVECVVSLKLKPNLPPKS